MKSPLLGASYPHEKIYFIEGSSYLGLFFIPNVVSLFGCKVVKNLILLCFSCSFYKAISASYDGAA